VNTPAVVEELGKTVTEPLWGTIAETAAELEEGMGICCGPAGVQKVTTAFTVTVPAGETVHDCVAVPPSEVVAVTVKLFDTRDWAGAGVQASVLPVRAAPVGLAVSEKLTVPPEGSVATIG